MILQFMSWKVNANRESAGFAQKLKNAKFLPSMLVDTTNFKLNGLQSFYSLVKGGKLLNRMEPVKTISCNFVFLFCACKKDNSTSEQ